MNPWFSYPVAFYCTIQAIASLAWGNDILLNHDPFIIEFMMSYIRRLTSEGSKMRLFLRRSDRSASIIKHLSSKCIWDPVGLPKSVPGLLVLNHLRITGVIHVGAPSEGSF